MKLFIGLGNPGEKYKNNRHNVGFMMLDYIIEQCQMSNVKCQIRNGGTFFKLDKYCESEIVEITIKNEKFILAKPQTFMNESGRAANKIMSNFKCQILNLYVVHDDLDIKLGEYKVQMGKGPKLHNGIESVEQSLGTKDFWRMRIGVDNRDHNNRILGEAYVLQNFTVDEVKTLETVFQSVLQEFQMTNFKF